MNATLSALIKHERTFQAFKYTIYALLFIDVILFFQDDWAASSYAFSQGVGLVDLIKAFAPTIDTAAWVILLLLFELETWVLEDEQIRGALKWSLHGVRFLCYSFIVYSFYGYLSRGWALAGFEPLADSHLCHLLGHYHSFMTDLDEYTALTQENCTRLSAQSPLLSSAVNGIVTNSTALKSAVGLAWTDIVNSATWLGVVLVLEIDVYLQLAGKYRDRFLRVNAVIKGLLYSTLFVVAAYWGYAGSFLDFWDAFLWLVAFIFIELNVFEWQAETSEPKAKAASPV